jgi:hypothetical protein
MRGLKFSTSTFFEYLERPLAKTLVASHLCESAKLRSDRMVKSSLARFTSLTSLAYRLGPYSLGTKIRRRPCIYGFFVGASSLTLVQVKP